MNRPHLALALLACISFGAAAQQSTTVVVVPTTISGCPVGFSAGHSNSLTQMLARDARLRGASQSMNVRMTNASSRDIISTQITVHGLSEHARLTPLNADTLPSGDLSKQVSLDLFVDAGREGDTDFRVWGFTSVQRIDLDSLTYADGSTWHAPTHHACSVVPSGVMLVAAAQ